MTDLQEIDAKISSMAVDLAVMKAKIGAIQSFYVPAIITLASMLIGFALGKFG